LPQRRPSFDTAVFIHFWRDGDHWLSPTVVLSKCDLLSNSLGVIDLSLELPNGAFQFGFSK
jgi:hypothetical protein